jgi:G3E family GTPase
LVIVTGFLGSGKTTLLNRLLHRRAQRGALGKLGIVVNELGAVGIDGALLGSDAASRPARQVELPGGCVCCLVSDDLERALVDLVASTPGLEAILLETTGVAEPLPITWAVQRPPADAHVRVAAIVTLVDALSFRASRALSPAVDPQVAHADVVLVTKAELANPQETAQVEREVRELAPRALVWIRDTEQHAAWLEGVLVDPDLHRAVAPAAGASHHGHDHDHDHDRAGAGAVDPAAGARGDRAPARSGGGGSDACRTSEQPAAHGIDSAWAWAPGIVDLEELEDQLAALPPNYVRIKGIVRATDGRVAGPAGAGPRWVAIHRVGLRVSAEPVPADADADAPPGGLAAACLVALGPGVIAETLSACIAAACA